MKKVLEVNDMNTICNICGKTIDFYEHGSGENE